MAVLACATMAAHATTRRLHACAAKKSVTVARDRAVRVYRRRGELFGCIYVTGKRTRLTNHRAFQEVAFEPPALAVAGPFVGYATDQPVYSEYPVGAVPTAVFVRDMRGESLPGTQVGNYGVKAGGFRIGSIKVKADNGAVAWIQCPNDPSRDDRVDGTSAPECVKASHRVNEVYKHDTLAFGDAGKQLLDSGEQIDPRSLRIDGSTVSWTKQGQRQTATLM